MVVLLGATARADETAAAKRLLAMGFVVQDADGSIKGPIVTFEDGAADLDHKPEELQAALKDIEELKNLKTVRWLGSYEGDAELKHLAGLTKLETLAVASGQITDDGLKSLEGLKNLRELNLLGSKITDKGLKRLAGLTSLESLRLEQTNISDAGLKNLEGLKNLQALFVRDTKVTDAGAAALQKALPKVRVVP
jgi:hypothetical protein